MPIRVQNNLPARAVLEGENIFVMDEDRAVSQDIRALEIIILNIMPLKEDTEVAILRSLSNSPLQTNITLLQIESHVSKNTSASHLNMFYKTFSEIKDKKYDGMIITGAPVEKLKFEEVDYWEELKTIMEWTNTHVTSTLHLCWGAQAGLYYHYGIGKHLLKKKVFGIYEHKVLNRKVPLVRGFDDVFLAPHSRYTAVSRQEIEENENLMILAESDEAGIYLVIDKADRRVFILGHPEYDRLTLDKEYRRDVDKGLDDVDLPKNYYPNDDPSNKPLLSWRCHANTIYSNWLNYYVYQNTPYELDAIGKEQ
ncbi:MAG: homoserine O-succinyltransferase [Lachnospiraceae bacterium]|nr:homoserine O-succinyltransferase [Lachnospiraceae bacterium]